MEWKITFPGNMKVDADTGDFVIHTDQPSSAGGDGSAPEPFKLFLASIGTCAGVYVLSYCRHHQLPTEGISLIQRFRTDPATHRLVGLDLEIRVPADFPPAQFKALERSANLCAVKKAIANPPEFTVNVVPGH